MFSAALAALAALALSSCASMPGSGNAKDPGGDPNAPFAKAVGKKLFGFSDTVFSYPDQFNPGKLSPDETIREARAAGANSTRLVFQMRLAEPAPGQWDENYISEVQKVAEGFSRRPVITLALVAPWANPGQAAKCPPGLDCRYPPDGDHRDDWQEFVRRAIHEFPSADIEVWNEPNFGSFWFPGIDAAGYVDLVKATWDVVKSERAAGRTKAKVLAGALAQVPDNGSKSALPWHFLADMYEHGLKGHYDAISWHPYRYQANDKIEAIGAKSSFARDWAEMRKVVRENDPGKHFWATETGVTRTGDGSKASEAQQAKAELELVRKILTMPDVDGVFIETLFVWAILPDSARNKGLGLIEAPNGDERNPTTAYCALVRQARGSSDLCP